MSLSPSVSSSSVSSSASSKSETNDAAAAIIVSDLVLPPAPKRAPLPEFVEPHSASFFAAGKPRCALCKKQRQKCIFSNVAGSKCDKCQKAGYECRIVDTVQSRAYAPRPTNTAKQTGTSRARVTCDACNRSHVKCAPDNRVWPARCNLCIRQGLNCSPPKVGPSASASVQNHAQDALIPTMSSDDGDSMEKIPAQLPTRKRMRSSNHAGGRGGDGLSQLQQTTQRMEEEYQEVIRDIQEKHSDELQATKVKYEQELAAVKNVHEKRVDDLIYIMKNNERRADELIQALRDRR